MMSHDLLAINGALGWSIASLQFAWGTRTRFISHALIAISTALFVAQLAYDIWSR